MKPQLIVEGKVYEVCNLEYKGNEVRMVGAITENGYEAFYDIKEDVSYFPLNKRVKQLDFSKQLKWKNEKVGDLLKHLDDYYESERGKLVNIAIESMELEDGGHFATILLEHHKQYKSYQQRLLGTIDAIEEVRAFIEGYYEGDN